MEVDPEMQLEPQTAFSKVAERLVDDADTYFPLQKSPSIGDIKVIKNPYSNTARIDLNFGVNSKTFYAKLPVIDEHNEAVVHHRLQKEFEHLKFLRESLRNYPELSVIKPVAYFPDLPALVTEEVSGPTLHDLLVKGTRHLGRRSMVRKLEYCCTLVGRWLAIFQRLTKKDPSEFNTNDVVEYCQIRLDRLSKLKKKPVSSTFSARFIQHIGDLAARIPKETNFIAARHNDFAPHNIVLDDHGIYLLDFTMWDDAETFYDLAGFWQRLESMKADPLHSERILRKLQACFFQGYGKSVDINSPGFRIGRCKYQLTQMLTLLERQSGLPYQRWRDRRLWHGYRDWLDQECFSIRD